MVVKIFWIFHSSPPGTQRRLVDGKRIIADPASSRKMAKTTRNP